MADLKEFFAPLATQRVDPANGIIYGVSVITSGIKARGHDLEVDTTTLSQIKECAEKLGTVPVKWNHRTGADAVAGYLENFRIEEGKLLGDWHLLKSHAQFGQAIEMAERMPRNVGLSAAFMGDDEISGGVKKARCSELISVDLVAQPAANPNGLFEAKLPSAPQEFTAQVDTSNKHRMDQNTNTTEASEPSLNDVLAALNQLTAQVTAQQETIAALQNGAGEQNEDISLEEIMSLTPEDLVQLIEAGEITEDDAAGIQAYQAEVAASFEENQGEEGKDSGELAGASAGVETSAGSSSELSALQKQVRELSARFEREDAASENAEIEHYFSTIEGNLSKLAEEKLQLTELSERLVAENDALRAAVKTGTRPLAFSAESQAVSGSRGELHEFESRVKTHTDSGKTHAQAVMLAHKENPEAHQDWILQQSK
jgi:hypothetical protein